MQAGRFEEAAALDGRETGFESSAVTIDQEPYLDTGRPQRPDAPIQICQIAHLGAVDGEDDVAGVQVGLLPRSAAGQPHDDDLALDFGGIDAEPWSRRSIGPPEPRQV